MIKTFTGIIEEVGTIKNISKNAHSLKLEIKSEKIIQETILGDSISTNGVCLTVTKLSKNSFFTEVMIQTLKNTNLNTLKINDKVNLERAVSLNRRLGGHIVSGHIDGIGKVINKKKFDIATKIEIETNDKILKYIVEKGSIAIDGVSLTVAKVYNNSFSVYIIPHTSDNTILLNKNCYDTVNIENDIFAKYIEKLINHEKSNNNSKINIKTLIDNGFL